MVPKIPQPKKCTIHGEPMKIFCFDCSKVICRDCTVIDHKDHNIQFNNVAAEDKKKELIENLKPLREVADSLSRAFITVDNTENEVEVQGTEGLPTLSRLHRSINDYILAIM